MDKKKICKVLNDQLIDVMLYIQFTGKSLMTDETFIQAIREIKQEIDAIELKLNNILVILENEKLLGVRND